jgi:type IV pilus assembly protein PilW
MKIRNSSGFSLVELMVAMAIGSLLIVGAVFVYSQSRTSFTLNETQARLQENGRYVLSVLEPEIQMAGFFGYTNTPGDFRYVNGAAETFVADTRQDDAAFAALPTAAQACGTNYVIDLLQTVQGADNRYDFAPAGDDCDPVGAGAQANTDTLTLRRASLTSALPDANKLQLFVSRQSPTNNLIFKANASPRTVVAGMEEVRDLVVQGYYVSQDSIGLEGVPSLRRKFLTTGPAIDDDEIMRGVEDLQVQFGIDVGADLNGDGTPDDFLGDGMADIVDGHATRYVDPEDPAASSGQIVSVRIWIRLRAEQPEAGYVNNTRYQYANTDFTANDSLRRVVVTRTIFLRNARSLNT